MAFSGLSTNLLFTNNTVGEDLSTVIATLAPIEAPFLDWLGDSNVFATSTKHEYVEDFMRPHYITVSTAVNSATAATGIQINGLGLALTVGTILENESAAPEVMQVSSIPGANSILVTRAYGGGTTGSLAAGGQLYVRAPAGLEGADHTGANTQRLGTRTANTVGLFQVEIAASGTQLAIANNTLGNDTLDSNRAKNIRQVLSDLEKEVIRGVWNSTNSLGTSAQTRTMKGIRNFVSTVNSTVTAASFAANPHLYIGNVWEQAYSNGAAETERWGIVAGRTWYRDISNLNDTKVQDTNRSEMFKRVIRSYEGPFGNCDVFLSRALPASELLIVSADRCKVVPLQGRTFQVLPMSISGDNRKEMIVGEYTIELHHESAMARMHT